MAALEEAQLIFFGWTFNKVSTSRGISSIHTLTTDTSSYDKYVRKTALRRQSADECNSSQNGKVIKGRSIKDVDASNS